MSNPVLQLPQAVAIENNYNTRHFGGYRTRQGTTVVRGRLLRSGMPSGFSMQDILYLKEEYNLSMILDLRATDEIRKFPPPVLTEGIEYRRIPVYEEEVPDSSEAGDKSEAFGARKDEEIEGIIRGYHELGGSRQGILDFFYDIYNVLVLAPKSQLAIRCFFDLLLNNREECYIFHCSGGKDRTGIFALLFLSALGVDLETCRRDFLLTNDYFDLIKAQELLKVSLYSDDPAVYDGVRLMYGVDPIYFDYAIEAIEKNYGSMNHYLRDAIKLTDSDIEQLHHIYTY